MRSMRAALCRLCLPPAESERRKGRVAGVSSSKFINHVEFRDLLGFDGWLLTKLLR
jgi:hypothetical protein